MSMRNTEERKSLFKMAKLYGC